jgi:predicted DNA-binding protein (MmcQ/YjbR family)
MTKSPLDRLRQICLAFPEAHEKIAWGEPTFRVRDKLFAMYASARNHHGAGKNAVWCKATHIDQELLIRSDADRFFSPPYVGPSGWVGIYLDGKPDWNVVGEQLRDAYRLVAPKKVLAQLNEVREPAATARKKRPQKRASRTRTI